MSQYTKYLVCWFSPPPPPGKHASNRLQDHILHLVVQMSHEVQYTHEDMLCKIQNFRTLWTWKYELVQVYFRKIFPSKGLKLKLCQTSKVITEMTFYALSLVNGPKYSIPCMLPLHLWVKTNRWVIPWISHEGWWWCEDCTQATF